MFATEERLEGVIGELNISYVREQMVVECPLMGFAFLGDLVLDTVSGNEHGENIEDLGTAWLELVEDNMPRKGSWIALRKNWTVDRSYGN